MSYNSYGGIIRECLKCPVCKHTLGLRELEETFMGHCDECRAIFTWLPNSKVPSAVLDNACKSNKCDCGTCQRRKPKEK